MSSRAILFALASILVAGCGSSRLPPSSGFPRTGVQGVAWVGAESKFGQSVASYAVWDDRLLFVVWSDLTISTGDATEGNDEVVFAGRHAAAGGREFQFRCSTSDGKRGPVTIDGQDYDLESWNIFLVTTKRGKPTVRPLKRDLGRLEANALGVEQLATSDASFAEFFAATGTGE